MRMLMIFPLLGLLGGCAGTDWNRNIYEGVRQRQQAITQPGSPEVVAPAPDYDRYRQERGALKNPQPAQQQ